MINVVFVAPFPMPATLKFIRALGALQGVRLLGVFQRAPRGPERRLFSEIVTVRDCLSVQQLDMALRQIRHRYGDIHRLLGILENLQEQLAVLRDHFGIVGVGQRTARLFRDKSAMKKALIEAGIPVARNRLVKTESDAHDFLKMIDGPVVVKPPQGAGCIGTRRVRSAAELKLALRQIPIRPILLEEFLTGAEHSMETFTLNGKVVMRSFSRYYPTPLQVVENPWMQWVVHFPKKVDTPLFKRASRIGEAAISALGLHTAMTHMEWFASPDGRISVGEIGARPPGAQITDATGRIHGKDAHFAWAKLMVFDQFDAPWVRQRSAAIAFLRAQGGRYISAVKGLDSAQHKMGKLVIDRQLPAVGARVSNSYEGDGWVLIEGDDDRLVKRAALDLITAVRVESIG